MTTINIFQAHAVLEKSPFNLDMLIGRFQQRAASWSIPESYLCLLIEASMADGAFDPEELASIQTIARRSRVLATLSAQELASVNESVNRRRSQNPVAFAEACASLPPDMAVSVFASCVDIITADGQLLNSEADFLERLRAGLAIPVEHARHVLEIMLIKAQY